MKKCDSTKDDNLKMFPVKVAKRACTKAKNPCYNEDLVYDLLGLDFDTTDSNPKESHIADLTTKKFKAFLNFAGQMEADFEDDTENVDISGNPSSDEDASDSKSLKVEDTNNNDSSNDHLANDSDSDDSIICVWPPVCSLHCNQVDEIPLKDENEEKNALVEEMPKKTMRAKRKLMPSQITCSEDKLSDNDYSPNGNGAEGRKPKFFKSRFMKSNASTSLDRKEKK